MAGIRPEPIRPGARGGRAEFSWDNVKADKDREYYLGHSVKALAGRWQKGKDVYWYTREKDGGGSTLQDEIKAVKQREEEAMLEALGLKPKTVKPLAPAALDANEMARLLHGRGDEEEGTGAQGAMGVPGVDAGAKVSGLGFSGLDSAGAPIISPKGGGGAHVMELGGTMAGVGITSNNAAGRTFGGGSSGTAGGGGGPLPPPPPLNTTAALLAMARAGVRLTSAQLKGLSGADRKVAKKARKEAKKEKKAAKKAAKDSKKKKRHGPSSSGSSSGSSSSDEGEQDRHRPHEARPHSNALPARGGPPHPSRRDDDSPRGRTTDRRADEVRRRHDSPEERRTHHERDSGRRGSEGVDRHHRDRGEGAALHGHHKLADRDQYNRRRSRSRSEDPGSGGRGDRHRQGGRKVSPSPSPSRRVRNSRHDTP